MNSQMVGEQIIAEQPRSDEFSTYRWESSNDKAWELYESALETKPQAERNFARPQKLFEHAIKAAHAANFHDHRCASSMAGKALCDYRRLKTKLYEDQKKDIVVDPTSQYAAILDVAQSAMSCFQASETPEAYFAQCGKLDQLIGQLLLQLCRSQDAEENLKSAIGWFEKASRESDADISRHALGKLYLCRREFKRAGDYFRKVWKSTTNDDRKALAYLDYLNVLIWLGNIRQGKQLMTYWKKIRQEPTAVPPAIQFRANLLFAKIELEVGDLSAAQSFLSSAEEMAVANPAKISPLGQNIRAILTSRTSVLRRDFETAKQIHKTIQPLTDYPTKGFGELEIVAVDAGCRQCISECLCLCYELQCDCCCPCECCAVCVESAEVTTTALFDFTSLFAAFSKWDLGEIQFHQGDFASAETNLNAALNQFSLVLGHRSPVNLGVLPPLLRAKRMQNDGNGFVELVDRLINTAEEAQKNNDGTIPELRSLDPVWVDIYSISGAERNAMGRYEVAETDFDNAIKAGEAIRSATHERTLQAHLGRTETLINQGELEFATNSIEALQESLALTGNCDPYYSLKIGLQRAKIYALCGRLDRSYDKLTVLENRWLNLAESGTYSKSNLAPVLLWKLIVELERAKEIPHEAALTNPRFISLYNDYMSCARVDEGLSTPMIAHHLNRVAVVLKGSKMFAAGAFLYRKAIELYSMANLPEHQAKVERNLNLLNTVVQKRRKHE